MKKKPKKKIHKIHKLGLKLLSAPDLKKDIEAYLGQLKNPKLARKTLLEAFAINDQRTRSLQDALLLSPHTDYVAWTEAKYAEYVAAKDAAKKSPCPEEKPRYSPSS